MTDRVLITGGFGYLGGRIAFELGREPRFTVRLASRRPQGPPDWLPEAETVAMDVRELETLPATVRDVQSVVHLAAMNENECAADPAGAVLVNTLGTLNLLRAAIDAGVERFIYFSTAHVYAAPLVGHITEETLTRSIHPYAITHRAAEDLVLAAHDQHEITGTVLRLSNGFGAPTHPGINRWTLLVNDLCRQAAGDTRRIVLHSSGVQRRNFITLGDIGRAVRHLLSLPRRDSGDGLFNLGGDASSSVWEMARLITARCSTVLSYMAEIVRPEPHPGETGLELVYGSDKIKKTGFHLSGDADSEIDDTLRLCHESFKVAI